MPWLSYAQNGGKTSASDARSLPSPKGFTSTSGRTTPSTARITKHFYDEGWTGINVEPAPRLFEVIAGQRTRDINLSVGCSNSDTSLTLYVGRGSASGMSTMKADEVAIHRTKGYEFDAVDVPVTTRARIEF